MSARFEPIVGRYMHLDLFGRAHRIYVEQAGEGTPLLCLHTAGADGRQYRALMNDARVTSKHRVIAFDMPWHGKSSPPAGWHNEDYQLTSANYTAMVLAIMTALDLDRPILIGCSIGGRIALHLALEHPGRFRAIIGLQAGAHVDPYYDLNFLHRPDVHGGEVCAADRVRAGWTRRARRGPLGNPVALHAGRSGCFQRRSLLLQARRRYQISRRGDRYQPLSAVSSVRRIRLFLHAGGNACCGKEHSGQRSDDHERPRPFPDEREPGRVLKTSVAGAGENRADVIVDRGKLAEP
jgi:pimeloyl-ACP methyl ester carboxylesterase